MATDKQHKIPNAPNLRFPEFSEDWQECELNNIAPNITSGRDKPTQGIFSLYGSTERIGTVEKPSYLDEIVLVARVGANAGMMQIVNEPCGVTDNALVVNASTWNKYVYYYLLQYNLNRLVFGSGQPLITGGMLKKIKIHYGVKAERERIVALLSLIDNRVSTQIVAISKQESLIKAMAGKLTCEGERVRIADLVDCHSSTMQENDITNNGPYPVYGATGICGYTDSPMCNEDAIIIVKDGSGVGNIKYASGGFSILGTLCYLTAKQNVSIGYVYCCLINFDFSPYKTGMAIPHIYFKDYGKDKINMTIIAEQQRTKTLLFLLMDKLDVERKLLEQYKLQKQYLLSQMFI